MELSASSIGTEEAVYWHQADKFVAWDESCRIPHTQASITPIR
jgi:hypothetical protein